MKNPHSVVNILSPALTAIVLSAFIAACTPVPNNEEISSSASSTSMMELSSATSPSSSTESSADAMQTSSVRSTAAASSLSTMNEPSAYKDGTYSADGIYRSPAGGEEIAVTLTLKDDVIVTAQVEGSATNGKSIKMQEAFIAGFGAQVIGKSIDDVSLGVINGSSLTPKGFMDAVVKIKTEAKGA